MRTKIFVDGNRVVDLNDERSIEPGEVIDSVPGLEFLFEIFRGAADERHMYFKTAAAPLAFGDKWLKAVNK